MNSRLISQRITSDPGPFVIRLSDGTRVPVVHPDFVAVSPGQVVVIGERRVGDYRCPVISPSRWRCH